MPKVLCMAGIVVSILVFLIFLIHLIATVATSFAPANGSSMTMDIVFILCAVALGVLSWMTFREQD